MEQDMEHDSASEHQHKETDRLISSTEEKPTYNTTDASGDGVSPPLQKSSSAPPSPHQQQENLQDGGQQQDVQDGSEGPTAAADTSRTSNQSDPDAIKVLNTSNRSGGSGGSGGAGSRQGSPAAKDGRYSISSRDQLQHMVVAGLVLSIIACIVFVILGIPALIFACRAQAELKYGTPQRSRKQANIAVTLGTIGTALGIALWILLTWFVFLKF